ncbi:MAG: chemotaxis protein CheW [Clostridiales Family XIII bacterium]|jgi:purine-binding chemotaxis protein CheW|nr:chemotaxis protein CheW [Clostridiales Family XIII bacterium]
MKPLFEEEYLPEEDTLSGRYLTFTVDGNLYGLAIRYVTEIIGVQESTRVPGTPDYIKGIINLRGKIIPLINVRLKFGKEEIPSDERTCVVVMEKDGAQVGLIVDRVNDVLTIPDEEIAPAPGTDAEGYFVEAIGKAGGHVQMILDAARLLKNEDPGELAGLPDTEE